MDTEKPEKSADQPKQDIGEIVGDLIVSGATVLANTAGKAVVKRVRKAAAKTTAVKTVAKAVNKKANKSSAVSKVAKGKKSKESFEEIRI